MATITLTVAANDDDWITDQDYNASSNGGAGTAIRLGGVGDTPPAGHGQGFRFTGAGALDGATINGAYLSLMKNGTAWVNLTTRLTFQDADAPATFDGTTGQPGDRAIVGTNIVDYAVDVNRTDGTRYQFPEVADQDVLAANLQSVTDRAGFVSVLALISNSDQDASAYANFGRTDFHPFESATSNSEPQLVVDYTAAAAAGNPWYAYAQQ